MNTSPIFSGLNRETFEHKNSTTYTKKAKRGLSEELVCHISSQKKEPQWMLNIRLQGLREFQKKPLPTWGPNLSSLRLHDIIYYATPDELVEENRSWDEVPADIKKTFERLGIPEAEKKCLLVLAHNMNQKPYITA